MPKFVIERDIPGAGSFPPEKWRKAAQTSRSVLNELGPEIQWVHSYVTGDKVYCVYIAPDEAMIRRHAEKSGIRADRISKVVTIIDPTTAEGR